MLVAPLVFTSNNPALVLATGVHPSRPLAENRNECPLGVCDEFCLYTDATHNPRPVVELTPYAIPVTFELKEAPLFTTPTQSIPLYEYMIETVDDPNAPATHNPCPFSSRP